MLVILSTPGCSIVDEGDIPMSMTIAHSGGISGQSFVHTGEAIYITGSADEGMFIAKVQNNDVQWAKASYSAGGDTLDQIIEAPDGKVAAVGRYGESGNDIIFTVMNPDGSLGFSLVLGGMRTDYGYYAAQVSDGYLIYGATWSVGAGDADLVLSKINSSGSLQWVKTYGSIEYDFCDGNVLIDSDNSIFIAGRTAVTGEADGWILHLDPEGNVLWEKRYGGSNWDQINSLSYTGDNSLVAAGVTSSLTGTSVGGWGSFVMKLDKSDGSILWQKYFDPKNSSEWVQDVFVSSEEIILTGDTWAYSWEPERESVIVRSLSSSDGSLNWQTVHGLDYREDECFEISRLDDGSYLTIGESSDSLLFLQLNPVGESSLRFADGDNSYLNASFTASATSCTVLSDPSGFGDRGLNPIFIDLTDLIIEKY